MSTNIHKITPISLPESDSNNVSIISAIQSSASPVKETTRPSKFSRVFARFCSCFIYQKRPQSEEISLLPMECAGNKKTLVLDLDETLVHSSLQQLEKFDLKLTIKVENDNIDIYVLVRPGAKEFLERVAEIYEVVIFTASLKAYADPVIDYLDTAKVVSGRLFRNECEFYNGSYIKNLSMLGRDLKKVIIVDNSPVSYSLHPYNAVAISSWFDDPTDNKLQEVLAVLEALESVDDVQQVLKVITNQSMELSPKNINILMDNSFLGRSTLNSPKPSETKQFVFSNL